MASFKTTVFDYYHHLLEQKIAGLQASLEALRESLQQETKSTAGDKYETARAMLHMEQDQITGQLTVLLGQKAALEHMPVHTVQQQAAPGSLIGTGKAYFLIGVALGKAVIEGQTVYAISPDAPLGKMMLGCSQGQQVTLNGTTYTIASVC